MRISSLVAIAAVIQAFTLLSSPAQATPPDAAVPPLADLPPAAPPPPAIPVLLPPPPADPQQAPPPPIAVPDDCTILITSDGAGVLDQSPALPVVLPATAQQFRALACPYLRLLGADQFATREVAQTFLTALETAMLRADRYLSCAGATDRAATLAAIVTVLSVPSANGFDELQRRKDQLLAWAQSGVGAGLHSYRLQARHSADPYDPDLLLDPSLWSPTLQVSVYNSGDNSLVFSSTFGSMRYDATERDRLCAFSTAASVRVVVDIIPNANSYYPTTAYVFEPSNLPCAEGRNWDRPEGPITRCTILLNDQGNSAPVFHLRFATRTEVPRTTLGWGAGEEAHMRLLSWDFEPRAGDSIVGFQIYAFRYTFLTLFADWDPIPIATASAQERWVHLWDDHQVPTYCVAAVVSRNGDRRVTPCSWAAGFWPPVPQGTGVAAGAGLGGDAGAVRTAP